MTKSWMCKQSLRRVIPVVLLLFCMQMVHGQSPDTQHDPDLVKPDKSLPADNQLFRTHLRNTTGPGALVLASFGASIGQLNDAPPEWGQGACGYGLRFADRIGRTAVRNGIELGLEALLHQDLSYRRCECSGWLGRTKHILASNFSARKRDGFHAFTIAKVASRYAAAAIAISWHPERYTVAGDGVRFGTYSVVSGTGVNAIREFWPEIRKLLRR
jgi:hypothetical protein